MNKIILTTLFLGLISQQSIYAKGFGKKDIDNFCKSRKIDSLSTIQPNGKQAQKGVLKMEAGKYSYPNGGALLLFPNGHYLMRIPSGSKALYGTDGDDLLASGGIVGGCSKAQLSEAIAKNSLNYKTFTLLKKYK